MAAGITPLEISRFMGHNKVTTTLGTYTHLFNAEDYADAMHALDAMSRCLPVQKTSFTFGRGLISETNPSTGNFSNVGGHPGIAISSPKPATCQSCSRRRAPTINVVGRHRVH
ncbi:MAG: hypothetical protein WAL26_16450 [Mycobacterium sp.]